MNQRLHAVAQIAAVVGAIGGVALTLYAGRGNGLPFLMVLMAGWVFAPFFGYALATRLTGRWPASTQTALDVLMLLIAVVALAIYIHDVAGPPHAQRATVYVAVPIASWLLMLIGISVTALVARRKVP